MTELFFALAGYMIIGATVVIGVWLIESSLAQRTDQTSCARCRYILRGLPPSTPCCPECGVAFAQQTPVPAGSRSVDRRSLWLGIGLLALVCAGCFGGLLLSIIRLPSFVHQAF